MGYTGGVPTSAEAIALGDKGYFSLQCRGHNDRFWDVLMPYGEGIYMFLGVFSLIGVTFYFVTSSVSIPLQITASIVPCAQQTLSQSCYVSYCDVGRTRARLSTTRSAPAASSTARLSSASTGRSRRVPVLVRSCTAAALRRSRPSALSRSSPAFLCRSPFASCALRCTGLASSISARLTLSTRLDSSLVLRCCLNALRGAHKDELLTRSLGQGCGTGQRALRPTCRVCPTASSCPTPLRARRLSLCRSWLPS